MDRPRLYHDDIVTWAEEPAAALRALAARSDLSNAVDWTNVIEEIESVGRAEIERVESALLQLLIHVLKDAAAPGAQSTKSWREDVLGSSFSTTQFPSVDETAHRLERAEVVSPRDRGCFSEDVRRRAARRVARPLAVHA